MPAFAPPLPSAPTRGEGVSLEDGERALSMHPFPLDCETEQTGEPQRNSADLYHPSLLFIRITRCYFPKSEKMNCKVKINMK